MRNQKILKISMLVIVCFAAATIFQNTATADDPTYESLLFTISDVVFFSYENNTMFELYDSTNTLIWNNSGLPSDKGDHALVNVPEGVYRATGSNKFAVLSGDPITNYVMGYYAMDQNGFGTSTEFYTWVPQLYGHCEFIIFGYYDDSNVLVEYTDSGVDIASFTLNDGEHWSADNIGSSWLHVIADQPVSVLTCYDQGYFVPSSTGAWSGTKFYAYVGNVQGWGQDLTAISYNDDTYVEIKDTITSTILWSGILDSGKSHVLSYPGGADKYFTITSDNTITVDVQPWVTYTNSYYQGAYVPDKDGAGIGTDFIGTALNSADFYVMAYQDDTTINVYNSETGTWVATYTLNRGESINADPGNGIWRVQSDKQISLWSGWGGGWSANFAPTEFGELLNPLQLTKTDNLEQGACVKSNDFINYTICFDNTNDFILHNVTLVDLLPSELTFIAASNDAFYDSETHKINWGFETIPANATDNCVWVLVQVNEDLLPGAIITNSVTIDCNETSSTTRFEQTPVCEITDTEPPITTKTIGAPQYDNGLWVNLSTPITLTATDPGNDSTGVKEIHYKINGVETIVQGDQVTFTFMEECSHTLEFWAVDNAGNEGNHTTQTHYVDDTGPNQTIQFGEPKDVTFILHNDMWYTGIGPNTPIWINSTDVGCDGGVGSSYLSYNLWLGQQYGDWISHGAQTIYDNQAGDMNPDVGKISVLLYMDESCWHQIHYWCVDLLGNRAPEPQGSYLNSDFVVDATAPTTQVSYTTPHMVINNDDYISCETEVVIYAFDTGCTPNGSGVMKVDWSVDRKLYDDVWQEVQFGTVYDNDANDLDSTPGKIKFIIHIAESCEHHIYMQATDYFGNMGPQLKKYVKVDCTPPVTIKEIGQPQYYNAAEDITYVTTQTPIWLNTTDEPGVCAVGCDYLHWEIYIFNETSQGWDLLGWSDEYSNKAVLYFGEESYHKLVWWAVDKFGNKEETHVQYHKVDNTPPTTVKEYGTPQCYQEEQFAKLDNGETDLCITSHTPIYLNATDGGECPAGVYMIYYKIWYNGAWSDWFNGAPQSNVVFTLDQLGAPWNLDCLHYINYYAVDNLMNTEEPQNQSFYVDNTPPVIVKTVGDPNCTIDDDEYCILPTTPITIDAYNDGCCADTGLTLRYKINDGDWVYPTYWPIEITIPESCTHILTIEAWDCLGNLATDVETFYVDIEAPTMTKTVGDPHCEQGEGTYCVTMQTPITVEATDQGCTIPCGPVTIEYNIGYDDVWTGWTVYTGAIYFSEPCEHTLMLRAYDCLGNGMDDSYWDVETFYVDETTPVIEKTVGRPQYDLGNGTYCVTTETDITINAYDEGCCDSLTVKYRINDDDWTDITLMLPYTFNFAEECEHTLYIWAYDCLGHTAYDNETFYVDESAPVIEKTVGNPNCSCDNITYCVTTDTEITINAYDTGCCICENITIEYRIWFNEQWTDWIHYNRSFTFEEACTHQLEIRAMDCLGNTVTDLETFYVDETSPELVKTVGNPHFYFGVDDAGHDVWYIYPLTEISFNAEDFGCCPCFETTIYYRYWYLGVWTDWMVYEENITFHKGCVHYLEAYAIDCLGNAGEIDNETFWVCTSGEAGPTVTFINPELGSTYCERTLEVLVKATDDITPSSELTVKIWIPGGRRNAPTFWYDTVYNETDGYFHAFIDLYEYQNGAELTIEAWAVDEDGYANYALPVTFMVCSNVGYDQWHQKGWNSLTIPWGEISCSFEVTDVLGSIDGNYAWVWYYDAVHDQWSSWYKYRDAGFNTLTMMEPGKQYWVYMETADRYFTDIYAPMVTITYPEDGAVFNTTIASITGTAFDNESGVDYVTITLYSNGTGKYWDGDSWETTATDLLCTGTETWSYDTTMVNWTGGLYIITATATDKVGCTAEDTHTFSIIVQICVSSRTYTTDADFNEGIFNGGIYAENNQLQLTPGEGITYPTLWVANAGEDSLSKWDTNTNQEIARYHTWFGPLANHGAWEGPAPSRTCVDSEGNCYVANRHFDGFPADVFKIYTDNWIDRNGNGVLDTSQDSNNNGIIEPSEMLPMTDLNSNNRVDPNEIADERIAWVAQVGAAGGVGRSVSIDIDGNIWVGLYNSRQYYKISSVDGSILAGPVNVAPHTPYGSLVDKYGILWSSGYPSNYLLRLDTATLETDFYSVGYMYGMTLGYDSAGNTLVYIGGGSPYSVFNSSSETTTYPAPAVISTLGVAIDSQGNIVAGSSSNGRVVKFSPNGSVIWNVAGQVNSEVRGVAVDSEDNVWAIHRDTSKLCKYNGTDGAYLGVYNSGLSPYTYSDATGLGYSSSVVTGKWNAIHDSQASETMWDIVSWTSEEPEGTSVTVKVRSSEDLMIWSPWEDVVNGNALETTPPGRYIEIEVTMKITSGDVSPILYDIEIDGTCAACTDSNPPVVNILDPLDGEMRTSSPSQLIIEAYDEESSVVDVYAKIHDATTNLFFNETGWQDSEAWLFCTSDINDQWYLDTDWSDEPNHTYHITAEAYDECGNIGTDMHTFTIIAEQQTYSLSGKIFYEGDETGILIIALFDQNPEDVNVTPIDTINLPEFEFPVAYTFNNLTDGTYYIAAHIDMNDNGGPPDADEPQGWAINNTMWLESPDPLSIVDADFTDADVTLAIPPVNHSPVVDITYPEDDDVINSDVLKINGTAYDEDTFVDEVQIQLYYYDDGFTAHYYNGTLGDWSLDPYSFTASGTGAGTLADPLLWELSIEPMIFPIGYNSFEVYAIVSDHDAITLTGADSNWFDWYLEQN
jgi:uncharacterized repeat protein (TIGR01451 family)